MPRSTRPLSQPSPSMPWQQGAFSKKSEPAASEVITDPGHDDNGGVGALLQNIPLVQLPLSTAAGAFDWVVLKTQESVQQLPFSGLDLFDLPWYSHGPMASGVKAPDNIRRADADQRRQALQSELRILETMLLATPPPNPTITEEEERRLDAEESTLDDDELLADWIEHTADKRPNPEETTNILDASFSVMPIVAPHCAWPRVTLAVELGPRCEWPRRASKSDVAQLDQSEDSVITYARCAWPRQGAGSNTKTQGVSHAASEASAAVDAAARCAWPRQVKRVSIEVGSLASEGSSRAVARCSWPRQATAANSLHQTMATEDAFSFSMESALSARCAWPRKPSTHGTRDMAASAYLTPSFADSNAVAAPRCAWPRQVKASDSVATAASIGASAPIADAAAIAAAPRCAWPRPAPAKSVTVAASTVSALTEAAPVAETPSPRCAWPRPAAASRSKTEVAASSSASALTADSAAPAPRCPWPRSASGSNSSSSSVKVEAALSSGGAPLSDAAQAAPRCAWPRKQPASAPVVTAAAGPPASFSSEESAPAPAAPRCPWPRQGQSQAVSAAEVAVAPAPRCAWPRKE